MGNLSVIFRIAIRNLFRNKRRTLLTLLTICVGMWSALSLSAIARGLSYQLKQDAIETFTGHIQIHAPGYLDDPVVERRFDPNNEKLLSVLSSPLIHGWASRVRVPAVVMSERDSFGIILLGIEPSAESKVSFLSDSISEGSFLSDSADRGLLLGKEFLETLQTSLKRRVVVMGEAGDHKIADRGFRITGVFDAELEITEKSFAVTSLESAQELLGIGQQVSEISIVLKNERDLEKVQTMLSLAVPELEVDSWEEVEPFASALLKLQGGFLYIWFGIVVIAVSFGLVNAIFMSIIERTKEIGLMLALGMRPALVRIQVLIESCVILLVGAILGTAAAWLTLSSLGGGIDLSMFAEGAAKIGLKSIVFPKIIPTDWIVANAMILILGGLGSLYPAWQASKKTPISTLSKA